MPFLLGLDFGQKRIGVAVSDESRSMAFPLTMIPFNGRKQVMQDLQKIMRQHPADTIVVGLPVTLAGHLGPAALKIKEHVKWFEAEMRDQAWILWDERLTTKEVERVLLAADMSREKREGVRDQLAAQRILQTYMDFTRNQPK